MPQHENIPQDTSAFQQLFEAQQSKPQLQLSYGQKAVGLTFNPSNIKDVDDAKLNCASVIDRLFAIKHSPDTSNEKLRLCEIAITEMQTAQMWAVKAITWKD